MYVLQKYHYILLGLIFSVTIYICTSCVPNQDKPSQNPVVARVGDYTLKKSEALLLTPIGMGEDTASVLDAEIKSWVQEELFIQEAYKALGQDSLINALVNDYKRNLISHYFERKIIAQMIDSTIYDDDILAYYEKNKEQFILQSDIIRCQFISIKKGHHMEAEIKKFWDKVDVDHNIDSLIRLANDYATTFLLNDSAWYVKEDLENLLPDNLTLKSTAYAREERFRDDSLSYYLRILEQVPGTKVAPLSFIEKQAREVISHRNKRKIMTDYKQQALQEALRTNKVEILN